MHRRMPALLLIGLTGLLAFGALALGRPSTATAREPQLRRYPYLTDAASSDATATGGNATVNWATDLSQSTGFVTYGEVSPDPESVLSHVVPATQTAITVDGVGEYQWKASITGLPPDAVYAYRVFLGDPALDLLGTDASPTFTTLPPPGDPTPFSFAVFGDWGASDATGANPDQANLMAQIAASPAEFAVSVGDVGYPNGSQANYGDLFQTGASISAVFGPQFYPQIGDHIPLFAAPGNHGFNATMLDVWPQPVTPTLSSGTYQMDTYNVPGTSTKRYPSVWYAFTVGNARFYILSAVWDNGNLGSGTLYSDDYAAHWTPTSPEHQWLENELSAHRAKLQFVFLHFPMYTDNATETTDSYLHGPGSLGELLSSYGVEFVFNGHAHIYERNYQQPGESFVSYVEGAGGAPLESVSLHGAFDAYAIGWSPTSNIGSARGAAPIPTSPAQVFSFLQVTVNRSHVTVDPINSLGQSFDAVTYSFRHRRI